MIRFIHPEILWLIAFLPLLGILKSRMGVSGALRYSTTEIAKKIAVSSKSSAGRWLSTLRLLAIGLLLLGLARPQFGNTLTEIDASGIDILLAVDVSGSMEAMDFTINGKPAGRLDVVKKEIAKFIKERPNDRIGVVVFAGRPYMVSPLTLDHNWLEQRLESVKTGMIEDGTAIGSAIGSGINHLREQKSKSKIMILLTDGINNVGKISPMTAAEASKALGIKIYTIGAGTHGEAPVPVKDQYGNKRMMMAKVDIDVDTLRKVAKITDGRYFRATDTDSLEKIYDEINKMERTTRKINRFEHYKELFPWAIFAALIILAIQFYLSQTRFRKLP